MKAVLYDRVSTDEVKQDPRRHLDELAAYAAARGWPEHGRFFDTISGDPARRGAGDPPGLRRAIDELQRLGADGVLVVRDAIRLVRSPLELLSMVSRVQALGAHVVGRDDGQDLDTTTDMGELLVFLKGWYGRMFLRFNRKQTTAALDQRRREVARAGGFVSKRSGVWRTGLGRPRAEHPGLGAAIADVNAGRNLTEAARAHGVPRATLRYKLGRLGTFRQKTGGSK